ncbi:hypothetical protein ACVIHC_007628 [Bradyrhizobium diazoefficiens]
MKSVIHSFLRGEADLPRKTSPQKPLELPAVPKMSRSAVIAVAIFLMAHLALLIGLTAPEKFVFDEVHYVPAARQMLAAGDVAADAQSDASAAGQGADRRVDCDVRR